MALFQSYTKYGIFPGVEMSIILECVTHLSYVHLQVIWNQYTYTCTLSSAQLISLLGGELLFFCCSDWVAYNHRKMFPTVLENGKPKIRRWLMESLWHSPPSPQTMTYCCVLAWWKCEGLFGICKSTHPMQEDPPIIT